MKLESLFNIDRRIVFIFVFLSLLIPLLVPFAMTCKPARDVIVMYELIDEAARAGKPIFLSFEFDPTGAAEQEPMARAVMRHIFARNGKAVVICKSGGQQGEQLHLQILEECAAEYGAVYGENWVYLPFKPGTTNIVINLGVNLRSTWPKDFKGEDLNSIPLTRDIVRLADFEYSMVVCSSLTIVVDWLTYGQSPYNLKMGFGVLGNVTPDCANYVNSGQIKGLLGGLIGAAQYGQLMLDNGVGLTRNSVAADMVTSRLPAFYARLADPDGPPVGRHVFGALSPEQQEAVRRSIDRKRDLLDDAGKKAIAAAINDAVGRDDIITDEHLGAFRLDRRTEQLVAGAEFDAVRPRVLRRLYVESLFPGQLVQASGPGQAMRWMTPQSIAHVVLIVAILFGNVCYFWDRARQKKRIGGSV